MTAIADKVISKNKPLYLDEESYNAGLNEVVHLGVVEMSVLDILNLINSIGSNEARITLGATYNKFRAFRVKRTHLIHDFNRKQDFKTLCSALEVFYETRNLKKVCTACNMTIHRFAELLLTHVSLTDAIKIVGEQAVSITLSKETVSHDLRYIATKYSESEEDILLHLSPTARIRLNEQAIREKQIALVVGLSNFGLGETKISNALNLSIRHVTRILDKHSNGKLRFKEEYSLSHRITTMQRQKISNTVIASNLGINIEVLDIVLRRMYISARIGG